MVAGFARYSVSDCSHIARPKKTAAGAVSRKESRLVAPGGLACVGRCRKKSGVLRKIFSLPRELKSGMAVERYVLEASTPNAR